MTTSTATIRKCFIASTIATLIIAGSGVLLSVNANADHLPVPFSIALTGDMPYDAKGATEAPNVIADINKNARVLFNLFDGDTMSGKGDKCVDAAYPALKTNFFDKFRAPVFYSVGDNEWVDCDRAVKGAFDPMTRLSLVRSNFFQNTQGYIQLGQQQLPSSSPIIHDVNYPEMQIFTYRGITVIIPHVPGSANNSPVASPTFKTYNDTPVDGNEAEYKARDAANVAWINKGFAIASENSSLGVIVVVQANMDWEGYARDAASPNNENSAAFANVKQALLTNTLAFKRPVLLQNGDEHWYQVDMPMNETAGKLIEKDKGTLVENFTRVQTFGSGQNHWVELIVDPTDPNLWSFKVHVVKVNIGKH